MRRSAFIATGAAAATTFGGLPSRAASSAQIVLGDEMFLDRAWRELEGRTVGVVTNQTGVTSSLETVVDAIVRSGNIALRALYAPEHGLRGDRPAGAYVPTYTDVRTGLPVYSLYGATRHPTSAMLAGVDVLLFDIQDVGDRAYTYISTLAYVMQAAQAYGKEVWVLDRPNPIGGMRVEGPVLDPHFASFIGLYPLAVRHGLTVGEIAKLYNEHFDIRCKLRVIAMEGYTRDMLWPDTGLRWVRTSPNIPTWQTALVYPATGMLSSAGVNVGIGTAKPFAFAGGNRVDATRLTEALAARNVPGVRFDAAAWSPASGFWAGKSLSGVELVVTDPATFTAVRAAVEIIVALRETSPASLTISAAELDRDWGTDTLRRGLAHGEDADTILAAWQSGTRAFETLRSRFLIYA